MRKNIKGLLALLLSLSLALSLLTGCGSTDPDSNQTEAPETSTPAAAEQDSESFSASSQTYDKEERVYIRASASGDAQEITVQTSLKNPGYGTDIPDKTNLTDIKNTKGDEEFTQSGSTLVWENHGEDIQYEGKSSAPLPITAHISYYLEEQPISPEALAGKSGRLRIRFAYENNTTQTVEVAGKQVETVVPFTVLTAIFLSDEVFSNVEVENGKVMSLGDQQVVVGMALPGLSSCLALTGYKPTEELTIPEYVELTADVTDFELDFTAAVASPGILEDMDLEDLDDADQLIDDMQELLNASSELADGTAELTDGAETMDSYLAEYVNGVNEIDNGTRTLAGYLDTLDQNTGSLTSGIEALASGLRELKEALDGLELPAGLADTDTAQAAAGLSEDAVVLSQSLAAAQEVLEQINDFCDSAERYTTDMEAIITAVKQELEMVDWSAMEESATEEARSQTKDALEKALEDTGLSEEQKNAILSEVIEHVDLSGVTSDAASHLTAALAAMETLPQLEIPELSVDVNGITMTIGDMQQQLSVLQAYADSASAQLNEDLPLLLESIGQLEESIGSLADGSAALADGAQALTEGISQLADGADQLSQGTSQLASYGEEITDGFGTLIEGMEALQEGMETFDEEGIQSLGDLAGDDLANVLDHIRAIKAADDNYINFGGIREGQTGSVRFILETEAIQK